MRRCLFYIISIITCFNTHFIQAQEYDTSVGIRVGTAYGVTIKHFLSEIGAIEGLIVRRQDGFRGIALLEGHFEIADQAFIFIGGGGHAGFRESGSEGNNAFIAGVDAIVGFEYVFDRVPFAFSVDYKPHYEFVNEDNFEDLYAQNAGVSFRIVF